MCISTHHHTSMNSTFFLERGFVIRLNDNLITCVSSYYLSMCVLSILEDRSAAYHRTDRGSRHTTCWPQQAQVWYFLTGVWGNQISASCVQCYIIYLSDLWQCHSGIYWKIMDLFSFTFQYAHVHTAWRDQSASAQAQEGNEGMRPSEVWWTFKGGILSQKGPRCFRKHHCKHHSPSY